MFIVVPYQTDVVARRFVWGTTALIAANLAVALVFGFPGSGSPTVESFVLRFGEFNPLQWVTSAFTHADWMHLIGNMLFLWTFGFVVEGILGAPRFLLVCLCLVLADGLVVQTLRLGAHGGGALGASGLAFGLMALAALWSPRSELTCFLWIVVVIRTAARCSVLFFCSLWVGFTVLIVVLQGFAMGTALLHALGAGLGVGAGVLMLRRGWVEAEGWDLLSPRRADPRATARVQGIVPVAADPPRPTAFPDVTPAPAPAPPRRPTLRTALDAGDAAGAVRAFAAARREDPAWNPPRRDHERFVALLARDGDEAFAIARLEEFVGAHRHGTAPARITLARLLLGLGRPTSALDHLGAIDAAELGDAGRAERDRLVERATEVQRSDRLELE